MGTQLDFVGSSEKSWPIMTASVWLAAERWESGETMTTLKNAIALLGCLTLLSTPLPSWAAKDDATETAPLTLESSQTPPEEEAVTPEAAPEEPVPPPVEFYNSGVSRFNGGDYPGAIADFDEAIRQRPDYAEAFMFRGAAYSQLGDWSEAIASLNQAIALNPTLARAYLLRGTAYYELGDIQRAIADVQAALVHDPTLVNGYLYQGLVDVQGGSTETAIANFTEAIRLNPDQLNAYILGALPTISRATIRPRSLIFPT
jgi:tetratricopeptide (TPR) repeat protein